MTQKVIEVAIAILYREGKFLLQLRDNIPGIVFPGFWGLFGGHLEIGETPDQAIKRELEEEINYNSLNPQLFRVEQKDQILRHIYYDNLTVPLEKLTLKEGWDFALVSPEKIVQGSCYSNIAGEVRPLGKPHQKILLDFLAINQIN
jgi:8-oxo-dGTP pyrophosphatase MutT (NUDIX family)